MMLPDLNQDVLHVAVAELVHKSNLLPKPLRLVPMTMPVPASGLIQNLSWKSSVVASDTETPGAAGLNAACMLACMLPLPFETTYTCCKVAAWLPSTRPK